MLNLRKNYFKVLFPAIAAGLLFFSPLGLADENTNLFLREIEKEQLNEPPAAEVALARGSNKELRFLADIGETYDSNIFLNKRKWKDDWITTSTPRIEASVQNSKTFLMLSGNVGMRLYALNGHQTNFNPGAALDMRFLRDSRFRINISETLQHSSSLQSTGPAGTSAENSILTKRWTNRFKTGLEYDLSPKTFLGLDYGQVFYRYTSGNIAYRSYMVQTISPSLNWRYSPKLIFFTRYDLETDTYFGQSERNFMAHTGELGARGVLTKKSSLVFSGGYRYTIYKLSDVKDAHGFIGKGSYEYKWTEKTLLTLFASHLFVPSTNSVSEEAEGNRSNYFINTIAGLTLRHFLTEKISELFSGFYGLQHQAPSQGTGVYAKAVNTSTLGATVSLNYQLNRWLALMFSYSYKYARCGRVKDKGYHDNQVTVALKGSY